ncbi:MAG: hypothetical protein M3011_00665 [Actinomycetota bacterium]|nr:hypothetical protein [Actinomycetota bacterium]
MSLPILYLEGLKQRAMRGDDHLNTYKLGLIEAVLKEALRADESEATSTRSAVQTALDVARWDLPRSVGSPN